MTASPSPHTERISPDAIRNAAFSRDRHGFDEEEVREFLARLAIDVQAGDAERSSLRSEVASLHEELARVRSGQGEEVDPHDISVRAVNLLSQAQQAADACVAEGEQYARELITAARRQYQEILERAQEAAAEAVAAMPMLEPVDAEPVEGYTVQVQEIEYVRTFAQVAQVQLRSVIEALTKEVDKLGQLPRLNGGPNVPSPSQNGQSHDNVYPESPTAVTWYPNRSIPPGVSD